MSLCAAPSPSALSAARIAAAHAVASIERHAIEWAERVERLVEP
jgi:hypothetical protein